MYTCEGASGSSSEVPWVGEIVAKRHLQGGWVTYNRVQRKNGWEYLSKKNYIISNTFIKLGIVVI